MRTKIKEIIATGGKFGMRGDFFFLVGGGFWLLFSRLLYSRWIGSGVSRVVLLEGLWYHQDNSDPWVYGFCFFFSFLCPLFSLSYFWNIEGTS